MTKFHDCNDGDEHGTTLVFGRRYRTRDGRATEPLRHWPEAPYGQVYAARLEGEEGGRSWAPCGCTTPGATHLRDLDLVEEIEMPGYLKGHATIDFVARRRAAIEAERESRAEYEAEDELEHELKRVRYEFEERMERERVQRQKYETAMAEKRAQSLARAGISCGG